MNNCLPYEEQLQQQWVDLPLPDENMAWADMKRRLEEDDDRKPFAWWRWPGCLLPGLLLIGLLAGGWFLLKPQKWFNKNSEGQRTENTVAPEQKETLSSADTYTNKESIKKETGDTTISTREKTENEYRSKSTKSNDTSLVVQKVQSSTNKTIKDNSYKTTPPLQKTNPANAVIKTGTGNKKKKTGTQKTTQPAKRKDSKPLDNGNEPAVPDTVVAVINPVPITDSNAIIKTNPIDKKDTVVNKVTAPQPVDTAKKAEAKKNEENKEKQKTPFLVSAGLGMHQQLPVAGQKFTPYNSLGRKGSIADYIPSVYLRLEKEKKWFLQSEFRYGAPQATKQFDFRQVIVRDTGSNPRFITTTSYNLRKTYYHQLPLTFNYYIRPGWSAGAGVQWNSLYAAVAEKTISRRDNLLQQDTILGKTIEGFKKDSAVEFSKSYFQLVFESQYQWRRFSIGARYTFGLQPYIRFSLPGQVPQEERNHALQVFLRYELWKQKKNK